MVRRRLTQGCKSGISLIPAGRKLAKRLAQYEVATFTGTCTLEGAIGRPIRKVLVQTANALDQRGFLARGGRAKNNLSGDVSHGAT